MDWHSNVTTLATGRLLAPILANANNIHDLRQDEEEAWACWQVFSHTGDFDKIW